MSLEGREFFTEQEAAAFGKKETAQTQDRGSPGRGRQGREGTGRTDRIPRPCIQQILVGLRIERRGNEADLASSWIRRMGKSPPLTPEGQKRAEDRQGIVDA